MASEKDVLCRVKGYDMGTGYGFVIPEGSCSSVFVYHTDIQMPGYRCLNREEMVVCDIYKKQDGKLVAKNVRAPPGMLLGGIWGNYTPVIGMVYSWMEDRGFGFVTVQNLNDKVFV